MSIPFQEIGMSAKSFVDGLVKSHKVVVFSKSYCPYCHKVSSIIKISFLILWNAFVFRVFSSKFLLLYQSFVGSLFIMFDAGRHFRREQH